MDDLPFVIFLILAAIFSLIKKITEKRDKKQQDQKRQQPEGRQTGPQKAASPWEEIRKYLENLDAPPKPQAPPVTPAPVRPQQPRPVDRQPACPEEPQPVEQEIPEPVHRSLSTVEGRHLTTRVEQEVAQFSQTTRSGMHRELEHEVEISALAREMADREGKPSSAEVEKQAPTAMQGRLHKRLRGHSLKEAIVLTEILGEPLALRREKTFQGE